MLRLAMSLGLVLAAAGASTPAGEPAGEALKGPEWPMYRGNSGFTGVSPDDSVKPPLKLLWSYRTDGDTSGDAGAGVTVGGGKVFVNIGNSNSILALDAHNGAFSWEYTDPDLGYTAVPTYDAGRVYLWKHKWARVGIVALDAATGKLLWYCPLKAHGGNSRRALPLHGGKLFCSEGGADPAIVAVNARDGSIAWRAPLGKEYGAAITGPSLAGGLVFASTRPGFEPSNSPQGSVVALNAEDGKILWRRKDICAYSPMATDGKVLVCPMKWSADKRLHLLDARTGETVWSAKEQGFYPPAAILDDKLLIKPYGSGFSALDRKDGKGLWGFARGGTGCCTPVVSGGFAYFGTGCPTGNDSEAPLAWSLTDAPRTRDIGWTMFAVDLRDGKPVWSFGTGDNVCGDPAIAYGRLYFISRDGRVYCFAPAKDGEPTVPEARDRAPNVAAEEVRKLLAPELAAKPRPGRDWPMQGGSPDRAGLEGITLDPPLAPAWKFDAGGRVCTAAAIRDGRVFFGSDSGKVFALDAAAGAKAWEFATGGNVRCSPAVVDGIVYCGSDDGRLYALDAASGQKKWEFACGGPVEASPAVVGGVLVFGANDHHTYALDRKTGRKLWSFRGSYYSHQAPPAVRGDRVFTAPWVDWVYALDLATGKELWKSYVPITTEALACYRDKLYLRTPYYVMEYDPASGKRLRMGGAACGYGALAFLKGLLYNSGIKGQYGTDGGTCLDLDAPGAEPKKIPTLEDVRLISGKGLLGTPYLAAMGAPLALGDKLCFATASGEVALVAPDGKKLWTAKLGGTCHAPPVAADGLLVVGCDDGFLYGFRSK